MLSRCNVKRKININPEYLGMDLLTHVKEKFIQDTLNECSLEYGHVIQIVNVEQIIDNSIENSNSDVLVEAEICIDFFKPIVGMILDTIVHSIYTDGVIVYAYNKQKILILTTNNKIISIGSNYMVQLTAVKYMNHSFNCIGVFT
jgi:DNA-directed RNA polymerase subunit E'/Rpb7